MGGARYIFKGEMLENLVDKVESIESRIDAYAHAAHTGTMRFGDVVGKLIAVEVESYYADYRAQRITYYRREGAPHTVQLDIPDMRIPDVFDVVAVRDAIKGAQCGDVLYPEFIRRTLAAGCIGYIVWIVGRHVTYFGRRGQVHMEPFPT